MRLELIRQNKLKITLRKDELQTYGVSAESIAGNPESARAMFFSVLKKAETEVGFAYSNSKLVVEAMPTPDDLVIFVTKVDNEAERRLYDKISMRQREAERYAALRSSREKEQLRASYMVELSSFDNLVEMCHGIPTYFGGTLYSSGGLYYVTVEAGMEQIVSEYGRMLDEGSQALIEEHGAPLIYRRTFDIIRNRFN